MKKAIIIVSTLITVLLFAVFIPLLLGYKIVYITDVKYDYAAIGAFGQWASACIPIFLVFLSAYITIKIEKGKKDIASSNLATIDYVKLIEKEINDKIDKKIVSNFQMSQHNMTNEEIHNLNKEKAYKFVCISMIAKTDAVANHLGINKGETFEILKELLLVDEKISCGGRLSEENIDNIIWLKRKS